MTRVKKKFSGLETTIMGRWLTLKEVAAVMRLKPDTIRRFWIKTGKLPATKLGRKWVIDEDDLVKVIEAAPSPSRPGYDDSGTPLPPPT